jgi:hypothetical protein
MSTGNLIGSSSLSNQNYRGSGTPHGARLNPHETIIQNGFKPTQTALPVEGSTCNERKVGVRHIVTGIAQPPQPMATKLRTLQKPGGKRGQRRCGHARGLLAARRTLHSPDQRGGNCAGCALGDPSQRLWRGTKIVRRRGSGSAFRKPQFAPSLQTS